MGYDRRCFFVPGDLCSFSESVPHCNLRFRFLTERSFNMCIFDFSAHHLCKKVFVFFKNIILCKIYRLLYMANHKLFPVSKKKKEKKIINQHLALTTQP